MLKSRDGITWTSQNIPNLIPLNGVAYGDGLFVAVGYPGTLFTSADATTWTQRESATVNWLNSVAFTKNTFVAGGSFGTILQSLPLPPQPRFLIEGSGWIAEHTLQLSIEAPVGAVLRVETSSDLVTWIGLTTIMSAKVVEQIRDVVTPDLTRRFYRVKCDSP